MRRARVAIGAIVLIVGVLVAGLGFYIGQVPTNAASSAAEAVTLSVRTLGPVEATIHWSGDSAGDAILLTDAPPQCIGTTGIVRSGAGASGSFSATLQPGKAYYLFACTATGEGVATQFRYTTVGLTYLIVIGLVVAVIGAILMLLGVRSGRTANPPPPSVPPAPAGSPPGPPPPSG